MSAPLFVHIPTKEFPLGWEETTLSVADNCCQKPGAFSDGVKSMQTQYSLQLLHNIRAGNDGTDLPI